MFCFGHRYVQGRHIADPRFERKDLRVSSCHKALLLLFLKVVTPAKIRTRATPTRIHGVALRGRDAVLLTVDGCAVRREDRIRAFTVGGQC